MFIAYFSYLLEAARGVLLDLGVSDLLVDSLIKEYSTGIPLIEPTPEKEHPARLRIGSSLAIHLSKDLHKAGYEHSPETLAERIASKICSREESDFHVDVGNKIFLNAHPTDSFFLKFTGTTIQSTVESFYLERCLKADPEYLKKIALTLREAVLKIGSAEEILHHICELEVSRVDRIVLLLALLSDEEFDIAAVKKGVPYSNNPLSVLSQCRSILQIRDDITPQSGSRNPYSKPAYLTMLDINIKNTEELIARFRYLELHATLRKRPELLWKEIFSSVLSLRSLWNDPWGRVALGGVLKTSDEDKIMYLKEMMKWIFVCWERYAGILERVSIEEVCFEK